MIYRVFINGEFSTKVQANDNITVATQDTINFFSREGFDPKRDKIELLPDANDQEYPNAEIKSFTPPNNSQMSFRDHAIVVHMNNMINTYGFESVTEILQYHYGLVLKESA